MPFAAAASRHPLATHAVGEVVGQVLEGIGRAPDLLLAWVAPPFLGALEDIDAALAATLAPGSRAVVAAAVPVGAGLEVTDGPGIVLFAVAGAGDDLRATWLAPGVSPGAPGAAGSGLLILGDDTDTDAERRAAALGAGRVAVAGGSLARTGGPATPDAVVDGRAHHGGTVAVGFPASMQPRVRASHGCEPLGDPLVVTAARPGLIEEIAGEPALDRLLRWIAESPDDDRARLARHLRIGVALDERPVERDGEDFDVLRLLGGDRTHRTVAIDGAVEVGQTIQLHAADARAAEHDLRSRIADAAAAAAVVLPCSTRGGAGSGATTDDAAVVAEQLDVAAVAGARVRRPYAVDRDRLVAHDGGVVLLLLDDPPT